MHNGLWRSLVAHLTGGQGVAGSNPVNPTSNVKQAIGQLPDGLFLFAAVSRAYDARAVSAAR